MKNRLLEIHYKLYLLNLLGILHKYQVLNLKIGGKPPFFVAQRMYIGGVHDDVAKDKSLYCASLVGYDGASVSNQTTHLIAENDNEAFNKASNFFIKMYHDRKVKNYISCIELKEVDGYKISASKKITYM